TCSFGERAVKRLSEMENRDTSSGDDEEQEAPLPPVNNHDRRIRRMLDSTVPLDIYLERRFENNRSDAVPDDSVRADEERDFVPVAFYADGPQRDEAGKVNVPDGGTVIIGGLPPMQTPAEAAEPVADFNHMWEALRWLQGVIDIDISNAHGLRGSVHIADL